MTQTKPGRYRIAEEFVSQLGYEVFNPKVQVTNGWLRGRRNVSIRQYIPGYIFVRFDIDEEGWQRINWQPGVRSLMYVGHEVPATVPDDVMEIMLRHGDLVPEHEVDRHLYAVGREVRVIDGPFSSFPGVIQDARRMRLTVLVSVFGRQAPVQLDRRQVKLQS